MRKYVRSGLRLLTLTIILGLLYVGFWPVAIDPVAWSPPKAPAMAGVYAPNRKLAAVTRIGEGVGIGPEGIAVDAQGRIYAGYIDGRIVRFSPDGKTHELFARTAGRPLGMKFGKNGNLYVADAVRGLLELTPKGGLKVLSSSAEGQAFGFTNDLDIAKDGTIYFSDSSTRFGVRDAIADIFEHRGTGRLLRYDPKTQRTTVLLRRLQYANGVAVAPDQSYVLVVETASYRVRVYWLSGPIKGKSDIFIDNLPGFPDGISSNGRDTFWLAMFTTRNPTADKLALRPTLRKMIWRLPKFVQPKPKRYAFVLGLGTDARVIHNLQDPNGRFAPVTSVLEVRGRLYLGSLSEPAIGYLTVPGSK